MGRSSKSVRQRCEQVEGRVTPEVIVLTHREELLAANTNAAVNKAPAGQGGANATALPNGGNGVTQAVSAATGGETVAGGDFDGSPAVVAGSASGGSGVSLLSPSGSSVKTFDAFGQGFVG